MAGSRKALARGVPPKPSNVGGTRGAEYLRSALVERSMQSRENVKSIPDEEVESIPGTPMNTPVDRAGVISCMPPGETDIIAALEELQVAANTRGSSSKKGAFV